MIDKEEYVTPKHGLRISYNGNFNYASFRDSTKGWFRANGYKMSEKEYSVKEKQLGKHIEIEFNAFRKIDEHIKSHIKLTLEITEMKSANNVDNGRILARTTAYLELDYKKKFDSRTGKFMLSIYNNQLIKQRINTHSDRLKRDIKNLQDTMKEQLELYT